MTMKVVMALGIIGFVAVFTSVLFSERDRARAPKPREAVLTPIEGKLDIRAIDDIRVNGRRILLCGVAFTKPASMRDLMTESAKRDFQARPVACKRIGSGTPCDGNVAATFGDRIVAQCITADGVDIAEAFSKAGYLCDLPGQSGGHYTACTRP